MAGREFQRDGAMKLKERCPNDLRFRFGIFSSFPLEDRREQAPCTPRRWAGKQQPAAPGPVPQRPRSITGRHVMTAYIKLLQRLGLAAYPERSVTLGRPPPPHLLPSPTSAVPHPTNWPSPAFFGSGVVDVLYAPASGRAAYNCITGSHRWICEPVWPSGKALGR